MRGFLYLHARDLVAARSFYRDLLGLPEVFADDEVVGYRIGTLQLTVARHPDPEEPDEWARQLGWDGGTSGQPSWGVEHDVAAFRRTVTALADAGVETRHDEPRWIGYWSFPVRDPMGNTVEVSATEPGAWPPTG